ncbi:MAG: two-component regulator propeller domain-containing protein, partial [Ignavibacteriaceae bacterium]
MRRLILFSQIFVLLFFSQVFSQTDYSFNHLTVENGLSQSAVTCIFQDKNGFMWFGTQDGLNRY